MCDVFTPRAFCAHLGLMDRPDLAVNYAKAVKQVLAMDGYMKNGSVVEVKMCVNPVLFTPQVM